MATFEVIPRLDGVFTLKCGETSVDLRLGQGSPPAPVMTQGRDPLGERVFGLQRFVSPQEQLQLLSLEQDIGKLEGDQALRTVLSAESIDIHAIARVSRTMDRAGGNAVCVVCVDPEMSDVLGRADPDGRGVPGG